MVAEMGWCEKLSMGCSAFDVHLELLNWAIVKNCPWNEDMCGNTFITGHHLQSFCCPHSCCVYSLGLLQFSGDIFDAVKQVSSARAAM